MNSSTQQCIYCGDTLPIVAFYSSNKSCCKSCHKEYQKEYQASRGRTAEHSILANAKHWAKRDDLPFDLTIDDIVIPEVCPVLGIPLERSGSRGPTDASPTLDKVIPSLGYVRGNVVIISSRANRIKTDASLGEVAAVARWLLAYSSF